jgi:hypothetical protein
MKDPLLVNHLTVLELYFLDCTSCNRIEDELSTYIQFIREPLVEAGPQYLIIEGIVSVMNYQIIHFRQTAWMAPKDKTSHLGERYPFSNMV